VNVEMEREACTPKASPSLCARQHTIIPRLTAKAAPGNPCHFIYRYYQKILIIASEIARFMAKVAKCNIAPGNIPNIALIFPVIRIGASVSRNAPFLSLNLSHL